MHGLSADVDQSTSATGPWSSNTTEDPAHLRVSGGGQVILLGTTMPSSVRGGPRHGGRLGWN